MKNTRKYIALVLSVLMIISAFPITAFASGNKSKTYTYADGTVINCRYTAETDTLYVNGNKLLLMSYGQIPTVDYSFSHLVIGKDVELVDFVDDATKPGAGSNKNNYYTNPFDLSFEEGSKCERFNEYSFCKSPVTNIDFTNAKNFLCIANYAFEFSQLESIIIPETVKEIGPCAFYSSKSLKELEISENVSGLAIYTSAFHNIAISEVTIPAGVEMIANTVFSNCKALKKVTFETKQTENGVIGLVGMGSDVFKNTAVKELIFPETLQAMDGDMKEMTALERVDFSKTKLTKLPSLMNSKHLKSVSFPTQGSYAIPSFEGCSALESVYIPDNATSYSSFSNCTSLKYARLPKGTTTLKNFHFCSNLEKIDYPNTITTVDGGAFTNCTKLVMTELKGNVKRIKYYAFYNCPNISFELPHSVTYVENNAFENSGITKAEFTSEGQKNAIINPSSFKNCKNLTSVVLSEAVGKTQTQNTGVVPEYAFAGCEKLESITIPSATSTIKEFAFENCKALKSVEFNSQTKLQELGIYAFHGCENLKSIELPTSVKTIGAGAFLNCSSLSDVNINDTAVTKLPVQVFSGCDFKEIDLQNITAIDEQAFYNNHNLSRVTLGNGIKKLRTEVFANCNITDLTVNSPLLTEKFSGVFDNVENITAHSNTEVSDYAQTNNINFTSLGDYTPNTTETTYNCPSSGSSTNSSYGLYNWRVDGNKFIISAASDQTKTSAYGYVYDGEKKYYIKDIVNQYGVDTVVVSEGITTVGSYFISGVTGIKHVELPSTLRTINNYAFSCTGLVEVTIPGNVIEIGNYAFSECESLEHLTFAERTDTQYTFNIKQYAFWRTNIDSVDPPDVQKVWGLSCQTCAFADCYRMKEVHIPEQTVVSTDAFGCDSNSVLRDEFDVYVVINSIAQERYINGNLRYKLDIEGDYVQGYVEMSNMSKWLYFADTKEMYYYADSTIIMDYDDDNKPTYRYDNGKILNKNDLDVEKLYIIDAVALNDWADFPLFEDVNPKEIYLPDTLEYIGNGTFSHLDRLQSIEIPDSVRSIGSNVFDDCKSLEYIKLGSGLEKIDDNFIKNNKTVKYVEIPEGVTEIGENAFYCCTALEEIAIPSTVTTIGTNAFNKCLNVKKVTLGSNVYAIGSGAFANLTFCDTVNFNCYPEAVTDPESVFKNLGTSTTGVTLSYNGGAIARFDIFNGKNIVKLNLGSNVVNIVNYENLPKLKYINVSQDNRFLFSYNGCLYQYFELSDRSASLYMVPTNLKEVEIYPNTLYIMSNAFGGGKIEHVELPEGVLAIGEEAFKDCTQLKRVILPSTLEDIENRAFRNCTKLKIVSIPSCKNIMAGAFRGCTNLASILLPHNLESIGNDAFRECTSLVSIVIPESCVDLGARMFLASGLRDVYVWDANDFSQVFLIELYESVHTVTIHTYVGSSAYAFAKSDNYPLVTYTDEDVFYDECRMMEDIYEGFIGFCGDEHGDIQYITVYEPTCLQDGYIIGVCEYCSVILEEKHISSTGHNYVNTVKIDPTYYSQGIEKYECTECGDTYTLYTSGLSVNAPKVCTVSGTVVIANDSTAQNGSTPLPSVDITLNGETLATTGADGKFSFALESGVYELVLKYNYGFERTVYLVVNVKNVNMGTIPMIACDWNKDGVIDDEDYNLFRYVIGSNSDSPSYLSFVDMNNDGKINVKDLVYMNNVKGLDSSEFTYPVIIIKGA